MSQQRSAEQQAIDQMTNNGNSTPQQHLWISNDQGVDAFAPPTETPQTPAPGQQQVVPQPQTPDLDVDGKTDDEFFRELEQQATQSQQTEQLSDIQQAQQATQVANQLEEQLSSEQPQDAQPSQETAEKVQQSAEEQKTSFDFTEFESAFEKQYEVPLSEAINSAKNIQQTFNQMQQVSQQIDMRMTQLELMQEWGVSRQEVDNRLSQAASVYRALSDNAKQRLRQRGSDTEVITYIWNQLNPQSNQTTPTTGVPGRASIANQTQSPQITPELIAIENDDDFFRQLEQTFIPG